MPQVPACLAGMPDCSFLLLDPLFYVFYVAAFLAVVSRVGYSRSAEAIYDALQFCCGRREHRQFMQSWRALKAAKGEVSRVSAQVRGAGVSGAGADADACV